MSFLAPLALLFGALAALGVVALHLLTTRRPPSAPLPTARFVPVADARAVARASRPTDLLLLALRALAVVLIAAAFARPVLNAAGPSVRTVVLLDRSRGVADSAAAGGLARVEAGEGGVIVPYDSGATIGALSPALVSARRAGARIARGADSVRLVIVGAFNDGTVDAATRTFRDAWPGRVEVRRVVAVADTARSEVPALVTPLIDDPLAPALRRLGTARGAQAVRIVRDPPTADDSLWARNGERALVHWPWRASSTAAPAGVTSLGAHPVTVVAPLARSALVPDSNARVIARWADAAPAAVERALGRGCVRQVGVGVPIAGDLTLRVPFVRFVEAMMEPCGGRRGPPVPEAEMEWLAGSGPLASARTLAASAQAEPSALASWLLAIAALLLVLELFVRRRSDA